MRTDRMRGDADRLDAESRALLELSVIRGIPDEDLAGVLGIAVDGVRQRREGVMRELGAESEGEREALEAALRAGAQPEREPDTETDPETDSEPVEAEIVPGPQPPLAPLEPEPASGSSQRPRRRLIALAGGAAVAALVAAALALGGEDADSPPPPQPAPAADAPKAGRLEPLGVGDASGSARITGPEDRRLLRLTVRGLPPVTDGGYVVWLYDSVSNARVLTGSRKGTFTLREPLPPGAGRYSFLDVSREPADGNPNHSGASVLRVALEQIPGS